ncbi:hypothetical protein WMY93_000937 [Mugilogobius chulae]|uniref:DH domain-containing protein n=1 Tax=Mugilogobius chulae TaxID=88201 RepID=A0AAW0Q6J2_9GOBI
MFPAVDALLSHHQHFLDGLKRRQRQSLEQEGSHNYQITQLGDILITQFSGSVGEGMKECYSVFCSRQNEATKFYKEQLQNSKKFQNHIRKIGQLPLVRRMGIPECFLLVTQRITKYPVLIERLIKNTEADTDEYKSLVQGLSLVKDTIEQVNSQVKEYEQMKRLREICWRLEPKSQGRMSEERVFRREDLLQNNRTLLHEGSVVWKTPGRQKEIHAVLLSDVLLLLQEKDQKFVFATVSGKLSRLSEKVPKLDQVFSVKLQPVSAEFPDNTGLAAEKGCWSGGGDGGQSHVPDLLLHLNMYEIYSSSKDGRDAWIKLIREAFVDEEPNSEEMAQLQQFQDSLRECDDQLRQCVEAKQQVWCLCLSCDGTRVSSQRPNLQSDAPDLQQGETLLQEAISEGEEEDSPETIYYVQQH